MNALEAYCHLTGYLIDKERKIWEHSLRQGYSFAFPRHNRVKLIESDLFNIEWIPFKSKMRIHTSAPDVIHMIEDFLILQLDLEQLDSEDYQNLRIRANIGEINIKDEYGFFLITTDPEVNFKLQLMTGYKNVDTRQTTSN